MEISPFRYQGPLEPAEVRGRDALLADLTERVSERRVTALLGPRRFGKTSVLRRLAADLSGVATLAVDLFGVQTNGDVVARLSSALEQAVPEVRRPAAELSASVGINLSAIPAQLQRAPRERPDARVLYGELVRLILRIAERTPLLIVWDEFQSIAEVAGATALLRTELQHHYDEVGLLFAGSAPAAMRDIFTRDDQPFFNQADLVEIDPLALAAVHGIIDDGFTSTGRRAGDVAGRIFALTGGHPQRTMRAADQVWRHTPPEGDAEDHWGAALLALRRAEASTLVAAFDELAVDQRKVLRVTASGGSLFGAAAKRIELSAGGARHARDALLAGGKLRYVGDALVVTDPLLADWLRDALPA